MTLSDCLWALSSFVFSPPSIAIIGAAFLAWYASAETIRENRRILKKRETMTMMQNIQWDANFITMRDAFIKVRDKKGGIGKTIKGTAQRRDVMKMLNYYEILAIGIKHDIFSDLVLKNFLRSRLVADWKATRPLVQKLREENDGNPDIFGEFEKLAVKWKKANESF